MRMACGGFLVSKLLMHHPQLFNRLLQYELADNNISQSATQAFSRHLWYLTAEPVPLALFSSQVPISERQVCVWYAVASL